MRFGDVGIVARRVFLLVVAVVTGHEVDASEVLDVKSLVRANSPAVVTVETRDRRGTPLGTASGFLISSDGILVTNQHVIRGAHSLIAYLENGGSYSVEKVIGFSCDTDLAVLQLNARGVKFPAVRLGHSEDIEVGERVIAIGSPIGLAATVSEGIISAIRREPRTDVRLLQTTAAISPGSSGGPLIHRGSAVIGVTTFGIRGGQNLNFAIPSEYIISILRKPTPTTLSSAGAQCGAPPSVTTTESQQPTSAAAQVFDQMSETIAALVDLACRNVARSNRDYQSCISKEIVKVQGLMTYLDEKTKTSTDAAQILLKCQNSWSRHGGLWNFDYFDICVRSETKRYRLRGYKVK